MKTSCLAIRLIVTVSMLYQFLSGCTADLPFVFCMCKNATQCLFGIALISPFFYIHIYLAIASPCSYTAKFVLDLLEIPKGKFYHDEAHISKTMQLPILCVKTTGLNLHNLLCFTRVTKIMQVH